MSRFLKAFANGELTVYRKGITNSYTLESEKIDICTVKADIQPYSSDLARKEYGIEIGACYKVYCDNDTRLEIGLYCNVNGGSDEYVIKHTEHWEKGTMLVIERWNGK